MGDRITTFNDCPHCGSKGTFECYEAISSLIKQDECTECGYMRVYNVTDDGTLITIGKAREIIPEGMHE